ncbi:hypothetical protein D9611_007948 [Ephemerocybe angulata]|uniref:Uncharacterized protein n=1 Tax=Ephemerocybe angulata TaxID=980116 RepID=A0A8H5CEI3_9AGAR|nr:hypothetical protein D9611_007948 [Tulosesus angulatus]
MWDHEDDARLFTTDALEKADTLIDLLVDWDMEMALPKGVRTLQHNASGNESRPDNVFISRQSADMIIRCNVLSERGVKTDHYFIETVLSAELTLAPVETIRNFKEVDWPHFEEYLQDLLADQPPDEPIPDEATFTKRVDDLVNKIQKAIEYAVPLAKKAPYARRWWNSHLSEMRDKKVEMGETAKRYRALPDHPIHAELKQHLVDYATEIIKAKNEHWEEYLTNASIEDLSTIGGYMKSPPGDGKSRIPTMKTMRDGREVSVTTNEEKAQVLMEAFLPPKPPPSAIPEEEHDPPLEAALPISPDRVRRHMLKLAPHKAPGLDGIPNVVLQKCANSLSPHLATIYTAVFELNVYYQGWKDSITCVLRKPGKPSYEVPKAYCPIALLPTIGKLLSAIVAEDITRLLETNYEFPRTHFGGRPNRTTTDALHLLVDKIKTAWRHKRVVSVLFLDVEGAFPNAVTEKVLQNLRKRRVPTPYVQMIERLLDGRRTKLRFDDYLSDFKSIDNGIGQGCPLSMIIYIIYNADLLEIRQDMDEDTIGYVDDAILIAEGKTFKDTTKMLKNMMTREGGANDWSRTHNSRFEMSKVALMHFSRRKDPNKPNKLMRKTAPRLTVQGARITVAEKYKYLGVIIDPELRWNVQVDRVIEKATYWVNLFRRLAKTNSGINSTVMRHLYKSVGIPQITYAADVWYTPPRVNEGGKRAIGSVRALTQLRRIQKTAAVAITGALKSTAYDALDVHAGITPMDILLETVHKRAYVRLCTLPETHILGPKAINAYCERDEKRDHPSPIDIMARRYCIDPRTVETIAPSGRSPDAPKTFDTLIEPDRELSIEHERNDDAPIKVYCDGSGIDGKIGAAASLYRGTDTRPMKTVHLHIGSKEEHSTYEAEWIGALLALWLISTIARDVIGLVPISLYIDNQSVIKSIRNPRPATGQYIREAFLKLADEVADTPNRPVGTAPCFTMKWISAHSEVSKNEAIDEEAKAAAAGKSSEWPQLPNRLRREALPISKSALQQGMKRAMKDSWTTQWRTSPRAKVLDEFDTEIPCKTFRELTSKLPRYQASLLMQLRTRHLPLNEYLHIRELSPTDKCQKCRGNRRETISHFLNECPAYHAQRRQLHDELGERRHDMKKVMKSKSDLKALATYMASTGRLKTDPPQRPIQT